MATPEQVAQAYYADQSRIARTAAQGVAAQWNMLDTGSLSQSWLASIGQLVLALVTGAQRRAAEQANPYLAAMAAAQGARLSTPTGVVADALAGVASDGRPMESLLYLPIMFTKRWIAEGRPLPEAMAHGRNTLALLAATQVADTGRAAVTVGMTGDKTWVSYVRHVTLPACGRCIILAGRSYSYSTGFQRHPNCDCTMIPRIHHANGSVGGPDPLSPQELFDQMSPEEQDKAFTKAGAEAIRLGSDLGQVVNARRGMQTAGGHLITTEGTTIRGYAGKRLGNFRKIEGERYRRSTIPRPMPEQLLKDARDRDEAVRLLQRFGYLDKPKDVAEAPTPAARQRSIELDAASEARARAEAAQAAAREEARRTAEAEAALARPRVLTPGEASVMQREMLGGQEWTAGQREALREYTAGWAGSINKALRTKQRKVHETVQQFTRDIHAAMRPLPRAVVLYRYVAPDAFGRGRKRPERLVDLVGKTLQDAGFLSTSIARSGYDDQFDQMALATMRQVLMEIDVPAGTSVAYVDELSAHPGQWEMLLDAGIKYQIESVSTEGRHTVVKVRVVP